MNILHLVSYAVFSGPLPPTLALVRAQRALGHQAWVAYDSLRGPFSPYEEGADPIMQASGLLPPGPPLGLSPKAGLAAWLRDRRRLRDFILEQNVDIVHTHQSHDHTLVALSGLIKLRVKRKVRRIHTAHAHRQMSGWPHRRWLWGQTDAVVVRSHHAQLLLRRALGRRYPIPSAVIPLGIELNGTDDPLSEAFRLENQEQNLEATLPQMRPHCPRCPVFVHAALMADRGQLELLEAWAQFLQRVSTVRPDTDLGCIPQLVFAGDGPQRLAITRRRDALGLTDGVHLPGYLQGAALHRLYARAQGAFIAQPGNDAGARAALEALRAQIPLLAVQTHREDALSELLAGGRGELLADRRVQTLLGGLVRWYTGLPGRLHGAHASRMWLESHRTTRQEALQTLCLYQSVLGEDEPCLERFKSSRAERVGA